MIFILMRFIENFDVVRRTSNSLGIPPGEYLIGNLRRHTHAGVDLNAIEFFTRKNQMVNYNLASVIFSFTDFIDTILAQPVNGDPAAHESGICAEFFYRALEKDSTDVGDVAAICPLSTG